MNNGMISNPQNYGKLPESFENDGTSNWIVLSKGEVIDILKTLEGIKRKLHIVLKS